MPAAPNALQARRAAGAAVAPSIATRDGKPVLALGTPGSYGICQTQAQALVQHIDFGLRHPGRDRGAARAAVGRRARAGRSAARRRRDRRAARARPRSRGGRAWTMTVGGMQGIAIDPGDRRDDRRLRPAARRLRRRGLREENTHALDRSASTFPHRARRRSLHPSGFGVRSDIGADRRGTRASRSACSPARSRRSPCSARPT